MSAVHPLDARIQKVNQRLKSARLGLVIERRGEKLSLRGTLPPRPGSSRMRPCQQRIPLDLPATVAGLRQGELEAKVIAAKLIERRFDWKDYLKPLNSVCEKASIEEKIDAFEAHFFQRAPLDAHGAAQAKTTWRKAYIPYLRKLQETLRRHSRLSLTEAIYAVLESLPANARSRQVGCTALGAFAQFCQIELPIDLKDFWGSYNSQRTRERQLPTDQLILESFQQIPNPSWQFVYGMLATYGLRNHEVFFCNYTLLQNGDPEAMVTVLETTKTGLHDVWPFYPEWVEAFKLRSPNLPPVNTDLTQTTLQRLGQLVSTQFRRYGLPFSPYDLRHAWAVRTIHFGLSDTVAARMMGHSVAVHTRTYHRWITLRDQRQAVQAALQQRSPTP